MSQITHTLTKDWFANKQNFRKEKCTYEYEAILQFLDQRSTVFFSKIESPIAAIILCRSPTECVEYWKL